MRLQSPILGEKQANLKLADLVDLMLSRHHMAQYRRENNA